MRQLWCFFFLRTQGGCHIYKTLLFKSWKITFRFIEAPKIKKSKKFRMMEERVSSDGQGSQDRRSLSTVSIVSSFSRCHPRISSKVSSPTPLSADCCIIRPLSGPRDRSGLQSSRTCTKAFYRALRRNYRSQNLVRSIYLHLSPIVLYIIFSPLSALNNIQTLMCIKF